MAYITTNHRFIIDDKHPSDVFDEMENFFSLYTTAIDDLQRVSVQLSVPTSFDITANKKMAESYRQFIQSLKYTMPDIHILPTKTHAAQTADDDTASEADNSVILLIQRLDGYALEDDEKPSLYRSVLGRLIPRFAEEKSEAGFYPERTQLTLPEPIQPPVPSAAIPVSPQSQPAQAYQMPVQQVPMPNQQSAIPPSTPNPAPAVAPMQPPLVNTEPTPHKPQPTRVQPPIQTPTAAPKPMVTVLPNIQKSAKPYQDLLTDAIMAAAKQWVDKSQVITQITLKSNDGLTTAMVEQLFNSFNHAHESTHTPHDAIDLVSYGYEVLKPKLATIGVSLSDEAQFGLKAKVQATPTDIARLQKGEVFSNEIKLGVKFMTQTQNQAQPNSNHHIAASPPDFSAMPSQTQSKLPQLNQNPQQIVLTIKSVDELGERQQKVREFPIIFASREAQIAHALRLFAANDLKPASGVYFAIVESQGQLLIDEIDPNITIARNDQPINRHDVLLPNDVLSINHAITVQLLLAQ
ncbi:hypothetical protein AFK20_08635 [Enhydrobacter aerosaccus]|uniref:Uncharacterized protein n=1 Tax=Enhydrobacter aerosaccus TaxID=225324 RepID=A0ABR5IKL8_9HYPH|nr:hypothetical protein [Enhydrobacter aerosaccus]KND21620.1 hypothetical protein AFK20_08635 [Enhydrobacter aerosaccus]